ncbi:XRE family transcriptional regulator [Streptomyces sp. GbtcB6]|uniref:XRE family transcriptional regulator n=1 Tax=Streptomyces sp. GbtcB6 TaxID=2824751 RepID=UPI001C2FE434|nr:XRE family transcriptional regulator [Streptomyces sp. GbtcB6]
MVREPRYRLVKPDLLRELMGRTGTGSDISGRELATQVGIPHGTVDALLRGATKTQPAGVAHDISRVIGVDLLILWAPTGRAVPDEDSVSDIPAAAARV